MSDIMVNSLGAVTFRDNIKLSVKTLQLFQIFGMENTKKFCLNFGNLPFAGYAVKIFYIIENIFYKIGLHLGRILASMISSRTEDIS